MAQIKPFKCVRPAADMAATIAALPYDVYNREEAKEVVKANPQSFLAIDRAETQFPDEVDTYDARVYAKASEMLQDWIQKGAFIRDEKECYYIYTLEMNGRSQSGIVACASIDDYANQVIKKHENTRADKEQDRINHVDTCSAQTGPIFLAYRNNDGMRQTMKGVFEEQEGQAIYDFEAEDGIRHTVYRIDNPEHVAAIRKHFSDMESVYIADGHHRAASAVKVGLKRREENPGFTGDEEFNFFLAVLFPDEELKILPYNRVVKDLNGLSKEAFLSKVEDNFELSMSDVPVSPDKKGTYGMFLDNTWYLLKAKGKILSDDAVDGLDVAVLQNSLLEPVLGITDPKTDKRIDFVGGIRGLKELERRCSLDCVVAFSMYPTSISELFAVSDNNRLMPPKSTWFEPKLRSGLFIHRI